MLSSLITTVTDTGGAFEISWNDVNAVQYRIVYQRRDGELITYVTTELFYTLEESERALGGILVVEAYNALGSSIFSVSTVVGAL